MLPVCNQGLSPIVGQIREVVQPVEVPVAAFPLRGRFNPYCKYLLPLLLLRILIFVILFISFCILSMNILLRNIFNI